jgi:AraC-like DNA-binding protein
MTNPGRKPVAGAAREAFRRLLAVAGRLKFQPHRIAHLLDAKGRHELTLPAEFPFAVSLFHFRERAFTQRLTWHERLEFLVPLDGPLRERMGDLVVDLQPGDLLVVDHLKLHQVVNVPGLDTRCVVITFMPEFVYSLGSPAHDYMFLLPFYAKLERQPHVLRASDPQAGPVYRELAELLPCYFDRPPLFQTGCKAMLLRVLHHLACRFQLSEVLRSEFVRQQERAEQLKKLLTRIETHYAEPLALADAARMVGMSPSRFTKVFKRATGMTLVAYLTHVRLSCAARMLRETTRLVAEIAAETGFADQSYLVRQFRKHFGQTPLAYRRAHSAQAPVERPSWVRQRRRGTAE